MKTSSVNRALAFGLFGTLVLAGIFAVLYLGRASPPQVGADAGPTAAPAPDDPPVAEAAPDEEPAGTVAGVGAAPDDEQFRKLLEGLNGHPWYAKWLDQATLGKLVAVLSLIASGESPRKLLAFLPVEGKLQTRHEGEREILDPASYSRYDGLVEVFVSLDDGACARVLMHLRPWLDRKVREIERPGETFRTLLTRAMGELLEVPVVTGEIPLSTTAVTMKIEIPALEALSQAQKHLFRMGPVNVRKVQEKLRALGRALGIERALSAYRPIAVGGH